MSNKRTKRLPKIIFGQLGVILAIFVIASALIFYSQGYRYDWKYFRIIRTGMVQLVTSPSPDHVIINGKDEGNDSQFSMSLTSGYYDIKITKDGYKDWARSIFIEQEKLVSFANIELFLQTPVVSDLTDQRNIDFLNLPYSYLAENSTNDLTFSQYEIWINGGLITRFSSKISSPIWYPDNNHIVFQTGNEIRVIDSMGYNSILLVQLSSVTPTKFAIGNKGKELFYLDGDKYKQAVIR